MALSHYLNQYWLNIKSAVWHPHEKNFTVCTYELNPKYMYVFGDYTFKITTTHSRGQWVKDNSVCQELYSVCFDCQKLTYGLIAHTTCCMRDIFLQGPYSLSNKMSYHQILQISKLWNMVLELSDDSEIRQVTQQQCCWGTCPISEWYNNFNTHFSRIWDFMRSGYKTSYCLVNKPPVSAVTVQHF